MPVVSTLQTPLSDFLDCFSKLLQAIGWMRSVVLPSATSHASSSLSTSLGTWDASCRVRWLAPQGADRGVLEDTRRWSAHARERWGSKNREPRTRQPKGEREDDARVSKVSKVRVLLGALVVLVLAAFAAG